MRGKLLTAAVASVLLFGCIEGGVLNRDLVFKNKNGDVVFSHVYHYKVKKQRCSYCHPKLFKKKFGYDKFTMQDIWNGKFCGACHNGTKAFDARKPENCTRCHKQKEREEK